MKRILLAIALSLVSIEAPALADSASISGDSCFSADDWGPYSQLTPHNEYGSHFTGTNAKDLVCPIALDDEFLGGRWRDVSWARITVRDTNYVSQSSCKLHGKTWSGTHYYSSTKSSGGSFSGGAKVLFWTNPLNHGFYIGPVSVLNFECHFESNTNYQGVRGYAIGE